MFVLGQFRLVFVIPQKLTAQYPIQGYKGKVKSKSDVTQWVLGKLIWIDSSGLVHV